MTKVPDWTPYDIRVLVGRYFRIRADHPGVGLGEYSPGDAAEPGIFRQLAADVEHSDLLLRLLNGEEPMPYEMWVAREQGVPDHSVKVSEEELHAALDEIAERVPVPWIVVVDKENEKPQCTMVLAVDLGHAINHAAGYDLTNLIGALIYASPVSDMLMSEITIGIGVRPQKEGE